MLRKALLAMRRISRLMVDFPALAYSHALLEGGDESGLLRHHTVLPGIERQAQHAFGAGLALFLSVDQDLHVR